MALVWPWSVQAPLNIVSVFTNSANLYWHPDMLWAGKIHQFGRPSAGLPFHAFRRSVARVCVAGRGLDRRPGFRAGAAFAGGEVHPSAHAAIFICRAYRRRSLAAFAALRPSTYNGVRHFLFVTPQLTLLAAIGLDRALTFLERRGRALALGCAALLVIAVVREIILMACPLPLSVPRLQ